MAALTLQFAEATGLRPATNQRQWNLMNGLHHLPNNDHDSGWVSESGDWVHLDEPYDSAKRPSELQRRETWLADRGQHGAWIAWGGLYSPDQTRPHLTTANPSLLHQLKLTLEALPPVISGDWPHWPWVSGDYWAQFISPSRSAAGGKRKPRAGTTYGWSKNAIEYRSSVGFKSLWRPDRPMSLANHKLLGDELKNLGVSPTTNAGHSKLQRVRSELENWLFAEYPRDTSASATATFDVYYGGQATKRYRSPQEQLAALDRIQSVLIASYPESKPLRDMLKQLASARLATVKAPAR
ncbi:hypothetical protein FAS41_29160 [Pseudomonas nicosulfuronedens]|uniref:DUF5623 domain-containing protein n=2 Tax=Pseudomonas TaxID=286 RepID=A0A5R9QL05_9PSED|nr:DUF5623 domain-containing protein [Pseudomonas nicosulfuronedens]TLX70076.1 hypothetical protein FAS41_29160 [Pseudomonas nicosulfuronedens]